jgi:FERM/RhoGEF/pleckstrin domain protein 2
MPVDALSDSTNPISDEQQNVDDMSIDQNAQCLLSSRYDQQSIMNPKRYNQHQQRANTTMHVCWHRNTSVGSVDIHQSVINQLSGYLLRKFKNSNGWQKLWVVYTNFCLFFYKTYQDEFPLASLPLLGYQISLPDEFDSINKDFVFKLKYKNHVYFFRAEGQYSFKRLES